MAKFKNCLEFYEQKLDGSFENGDPSCYEIDGDLLDEVCKIEEVIWQAVEVDGFDNRKVLVKMLITEDGALAYDEAFHIEARVVRTDTPSKFVVWGDKKPHIFAIDRDKSRIKIFVKLPFPIHKTNDDNPTSLKSPDRRKYTSPVLPCAIGDTLFVLTSDSPSGYEITRCKDIVGVFRKNCPAVKVIAPSVYDDWGFAVWELYSEDFGVKVFTDEDEARKHAAK